MHKIPIKRRCFYKVLEWVLTWALCGLELWVVSPMPGLLPLVRSGRRPAWVWLSLRSIEETPWQGFEPPESEVDIWTSAVRHKVKWHLQTQINYPEPDLFPRLCPFKAFILQGSSTKVNFNSI